MGGPLAWGGGYRWTRSIESFSQLFRPFALRNSIIRQQTQICKSFLEEPHVLHHDVEAVKHAQATGGGRSNGPYADSPPLSDHFQGGGGEGGGSGGGEGGCQERGGEASYHKMTAASR